LFRRWQRDGVWAQVLTGLQMMADADGEITWDISVDSTIMRAHQHAAGARRSGDEQLESPGGLATEPVDHALGRSRGGRTTKLHLAHSRLRRAIRRRAWCSQGAPNITCTIKQKGLGDAECFDYGPR
jgi:hypothetical protein